MFPFCLLRAGDEQKENARYTTWLRGVDGGGDVCCRACDVCLCVLGCDVGSSSAQKAASGYKQASVQARLSPDVVGPLLAAIAELSQPNQPRSRETATTTTPDFIAILGFRNRFKGSEEKRPRFTISLREKAHGKFRIRASACCDACGQQKTGS